MYKISNDKLIFEYVPNIENFQEYRCCMYMSSDDIVTYHDYDIHISNNVFTCICDTQIILKIYTIPLVVSCTSCKKYFFITSNQIFTSSKK